MARQKPTKPKAPKAKGSSKNRAAVPSKSRKGKRKTKHVPLTEGFSSAPASDADESSAVPSIPTRRSPRSSPLIFTQDSGADDDFEADHFSDSEGDEDQDFDDECSSPEDDAPRANTSDGEQYHATKAINSSAREGVKNPVRKDEKQPAGDGQKHPVSDEVKHQPILTLKKEGSPSACSSPESSGDDCIFQGTVAGAKPEHEARDDTQIPQTSPVATVPSSPSERTPLPELPQLQAKKRLTPPASRQNKTKPISGAALNVSDQGQKLLLSAAPRSPQRPSLQELMDTCKDTQQKQLQQALDVVIPALNRQCDTAANAPPKAKPNPAQMLSADAYKERVEMLEDRVRSLSSLLLDERQDAETRRLDMDQAAESRDEARFDLQELQDKFDAKPPPPTHDYERLSNPEYASRFQILMRAGHDMTDVHVALELTKQEGKYSVTRADTHLKAEGEAQMRAATLKANKARPAQDQPDNGILENSALAKILGERGDATDIVLKMREFHAKGRSKNTHSAKPALCAANMIELVPVKNDSSLLRLGISFLCRVAGAVSDDCDTCKSMREKLEKEEAWKAQTLKATADKAARAQEKREANERKEREKDEASGTDSLPFKPEDSKIDVTRPKGACRICKHGQLGTKRTKWLYFCQSCPRTAAGIHPYCTEWTFFRRAADNQTIFACEQCVERRAHLISIGQPVEQWAPLLNCKGAAPNHTEALEVALTTIANRQQLFGGQPASLGSLSALRAGHDMPPTPPSTSLLELYSPNRGSTVASYVGDASLQGPDPPNKNSAKTNVTVKDYIPWDPIPPDWAPKADAKDRDHPEKGWSKEAYRLWRRKNISLRDSVRAKGSSLGPLVNGISSEMKVTVATQLLLESKIPGVWERDPAMSAAEIDLWANLFVLQDPEFNWLNRVSDETLLFVLDRKFGVVKSDVFLSKRFPSDLPQTTPQGDVNYPVADFNRWATTWQTEYSELQKSGCDFSNVNMRQTLLNALSTNHTLWDAASKHTAQSPYLLIAHLREWVSMKANAAIAARNERDTVLQNGGNSSIHAGTGQTQPSTQTQQQAMLLLTQSVSTLTSQIQQMAQGGHSATTGGQSAQTNVELKPLLAHMMACRDATKCKCKGCGNIWDRKRPVPCFKACKYVDHPLYNKACNDTDYTSLKDPITWKTYRAMFPYPNFELPPAFLQWEKREEQFQAHKRKRDAPATKP